jgi:hypothetical protein
VVSSRLARSQAKSHRCATFLFALCFRSTYILSPWVYTLLAILRYL